VGLKQQGIMMYTMAKGSNAANDVPKKTARSLVKNYLNCVLLFPVTRMRPNKFIQNQKGTPGQILFDLCLKPNRHVITFSSKKTAHLKITSFHLICQLFDAFYSNL
jgi:hypothetical protein